MTPTHFGRYTVTRQLDSGGMADIYLAHDPQLKREVIIKAPRVEHLSPDVLSRFRLEAEAIVNLNPHAIVGLYDTGDEDGRPYLVMRYMSGGSLAGRLAGGKSMSPQAALPIIKRVAEALDHAHKRGVLHRDVKPGNILFDEEGRAFLSDFGIAKFVRQGDDVTQAHLTQPGLITGTMAYVSPEYVKGIEEPDARSDVYSLGIVVYEMLAGGLPYVDTSPPLQAALHVNADIPQIRARRPDLPEAVEAVIGRALAKQPDDRYQSAGELARALQEALATSPPAPLPAPAGPPAEETPASPKGSRPPSSRATPRPNPRRPQPGQTWLGRFQIRQQQVDIAGHAIAAFLAHDTATRRDVDLWLWPRTRTRGTGQTHLFLRDDYFRVHEAIVSVIAHGNDRGSVWLAVPHMPGGTLAQRRDGGPLAPGQAAAILARLAAALDYAHGRGQVHGRLRPRHVLFDVRDAAYLAFLLPLEFIAHDLQATGLFVAADDEFIDPAQGHGDPTAPGDIYALGGLLYAMLTGRSPQGYDPANEPEGAPRLPPAIRPIIACALNPDPAARYRTAGQLAAEFERAARRPANS